MKKEKYKIEYVFDKASKQSLWTRIATSTGLSEWFADEVTDVDNELFTFTWNKHSVQAKVIGINPNIYIRFRWMEDEDTDAFFEFRIQKIELTGGLTLEITDFAYPDEKDDSVALWDSEITVLKRTLGIL